MKSFVYVLAVSLAFSGAGCETPEQLQARYQVEREEFEREQAWLASLTPEQRFQWQLLQEMRAIEAERTRAAVWASGMRDVDEGLNRIDFRMPVYQMGSGQGPMDTWRQMKQDELRDLVIRREHSEMMQPSRYGR